MGGFATAINCIDGRVQVPVIDYIKERFDVDYVDMITLPGVDKVLADNEDTIAINSIRAAAVRSAARDGSKSIVAVCGHYDCLGNPSDSDTQIKEIIASMKVVKSWGLDVDVIGLWVDENRHVKAVG